MRALARSAFLPCVLVPCVAFGNGSLRELAVKEHHVQAKQLLSTAKTKANGLRLQATQRDEISKTKREQLGKDITESIATTKRSLEQLGPKIQGFKTTVGTIESEHASKLAERDSEAARIEGLRKALPFVPRVFGFAFGKRGLGLLRAYKAEKGKLATLSSLTEDLKGKLGKLKGELASFSENEANLIATLARHEGRSLDAEVSKATEKEIESLHAQAEQIEAGAKQEIRRLVTAFVTQRVKPTRAPIEEALEVGHGAVGDAEHAISKATHAENTLDDLQRASASKAFDTAVFGEKEGMGALIHSLDQLNTTMSASSAQNAITEMNNAVSKLNARASKLSAMVRQLKLGHGGHGDIQRVNADVVTMAFVDLALDYATFETSALDILESGVEMIATSSASSKVREVKGRLQRQHEQLRRTRDALKDNLSKIDAESADIVNKAIDDLVASGNAG